jgi:hypothetical protein
MFGTIEPSSPAILEPDQEMSMPTIDFTLDDFRHVVREEATQVLNDNFQRLFDRAFDQAFGKAFGPAFDQAFQRSFKPAFDAAFEPWAVAIQTDFNQVHARLDRLEDGIVEIKTDIHDIKPDIKALKRSDRQQTLDIADLRSRII